MAGYLSATRHPWATLVFLLPLIIIYEGGVLYFSQTTGETVRNGADDWLRWALASYGFGQVWMAPLLVVAYFVFLSWWNWSDRPQEPLATCTGMLLESIGYAVVLWMIARNFDQLLKMAGIPLADVTPAVTFRTPAGAQMIGYIGAGLYEEIIFRLGLFSVLFFLFRLVFLPVFLALPLSAMLGAVVFAAAHHVHGEPIETTKFLFRTFAGLCFTAIYVSRGFGIAVGAHAGYDILVGVAVG
jgi:hypothetical protein